MGVKALKILTFRVHQGLHGSGQAYSGCKGARVEGLVARSRKEDGGGIYLFKDEKSVEDHLGGKIVADVMKNPALSDIDAKIFDVLPEHTKGHSRTHLIPFLSG